MTEERCEKHDLLPGQCAPCRGLLDPEEEAREERKTLIGSGSWTEAKWRGKCWACGEWFREGAAIRPVGDGHGSGWIAECCADEDGAA